MANSWGKPAQTFGTLQKNPNPFQQQKKSPPQPRITTDGFEILKDIPQSVTKTVQEQAKTGLNEAIKNVTGVDFSTTLGIKGEMKPGKAVDLAKLSQNPEAAQKAAEKKPAPSIEAGIKLPNFAGEIIHASENAAMKEKQNLQRNVQELSMEIQKITAQTRDAGLKREVSQAVGENPTPDIATASLLRHFLSLAKDVQQRSSESGTWQKTVQGKKNVQGMIGQPQKKQAKSTGFMGRAKPQSRNDIVNSETNAAKSG